MQIATTKTVSVTMTESEANSIMRCLAYVRDNCLITQAELDKRVAVLMINGIRAALWDNDMNDDSYDIDHDD